MNVLMVWNGPANAAERTVLARREVPLLRQLIADGVRPTVILCGDDGGLRADLESGGIDVEVLPIPLPPAPDALRRLPGVSIRLRALLAKRKPDILEGCEPMPAIAVGIAAWSRARHGAAVVYRRQHSRGRSRVHAASRLAAHLADRTLVSCEAMKQYAAADDGTPLERIEIAMTGAAEPRAVAAAEVAEARRSLGIEERAQVIGVVSRLRREKGIDVLLRALRGIDASGNVHVVIAGMGPEESQLRALAAELPVPVHFLGNRDDVALWFAAADVIAMPSRQEAFGRVTVEAMAAGRSLVASRVGGLCEGVVDGETGLLVPPEDSDAFAAALRRMLADQGALARRCGVAARARYESRFTIAHMATRRRAAWERILSSGNG